jgi:4-hydroxybenzoate polyprenyltransferase
MLSVPQKGYFSRMNVYQHEMFPLPLRFINAAVLFISLISIMCAIHGVRLSLLSMSTLAGIWTVFALTFILRLMDELKDKDIDRQLFQDRPLPSGKVLENDIVFSLTFMVILYLLSNIWSVRVFWMSIVVLAYAFLMSKYFFIPDILRRYLLLNLATHNPITAVLFVYVVILFSVRSGLTLQQLNWKSLILLIIMFWAMVFAWEISRKIRCKEEENEYVTYSQLLGRIGAVMVAGGAQTITFVIGCYFYVALSLSWAYLAILSIGYVITMVAHLRFVVFPNPKTSKLKPFAERYIIFVLIAHVINIILHA